MSETLVAHLDAQLRAAKGELARLQGIVATQRGIIDRLQAEERSCLPGLLVALCYGTVAGLLLGWGLL